jgi:hypothetical protein
MADTMTVSIDDSRASQNETAAIRTALRSEKERRQNKMNLAVGTKSARSLKAIKAHYLVLITGVTLAVMVLVSVASFRVDSGGSAAQIDRQPLPTAASPADQKYVTFYIVASEAERERVIALENTGQTERWINNIPEPNYSYAVFVARTPAEVGSAMMSIYEAAGSTGDAIVKVVDHTAR